LHREPKIIGCLVRDPEYKDELKKFEETLQSTFYEDLISDEILDEDMIRILVELIEVEFEKAKSPEEAFSKDNFMLRMLVSYERRNECKRYVRSVLKNPL